MVETKEDKTNTKTTSLKLPEGVEIDDIYTWNEQIEDSFNDIFLAHLSVMTPEQAVKKGYIDSVDDHPNYKKKVA